MRTIDLARDAGISSQAVRDYEAWGVLPPVEREANGYRCYTERHLRALQTVRSLLHAGYEKDEVRELMSAAHTGSLDCALAIIDARHAVLNGRRQQADQVLETIKALMWGVGSSVGPDLHIGAAAEALGVPTSTLRFWEQEGLLQPARDRSNRYRTYDQFQLQRLKVIALLRSGDYSYPAIRAVVDDMTVDSPESSLHTMAKRQNEITEESRACIAATTAYWNYLSSNELPAPVDQQ